MNVQDEAIAICVLAEIVEAIVVCPDNGRGPCADCGRKVVWRPHAPAGVRVCVECYLTNRASVDDALILTSEAAKDVIEIQGTLAAHANRRKAGDN